MLNNNLGHDMQFAVAALLDGKTIDQVAGALSALVSALQEKLAAPSQAAPVSALSLADLARLLIRERADRNRFIDTALFGEPAWDMVLDLFDNGARAKRVSVSSLCIASCVPYSTALRYIGLLEERGVIKREDDPHDGRRYYLALTPKGYADMHAFLTNVAHNRGVTLLPEPSPFYAGQSAGAVPCHLPPE